MTTPSQQDHADATPEPGKGSGSSATPGTGDAAGTNATAETGQGTGTNAAAETGDATGTNATADSNQETGTGEGTEAETSEDLDAYLDTLVGNDTDPDQGLQKRKKLPRSNPLAMFANPKSIVGLAIIGVFILVAIFQEWLAPYEPLVKDYTALRQAPSAEHLMGTTHMGEDVFSQLIYGTRGVLIVGFTAGILSTVIAVIVGVSAGYLTGWKSEVLSAITNVVLIVPALPLIIIVASRYENPNLFMIAGILAITSWAWGGACAPVTDDVLEEPGLRKGREGERRVDTPTDLG